MIYVNVKEGDIPGVIFKDGELYGEMGGNYFPVIGLVWSREANGLVPVLDIPQMSDERWNEIAAQGKPVTA